MMQKLQHKRKPKKKEKEKTKETQTKAGKTMKRASKTEKKKWCPLDPPSPSDSTRYDEAGLLHSLCLLGTMGQYSPMARQPPEHYGKESLAGLIFQVGQWFSGIVIVWLLYAAQCSEILVGIVSLSGVAVCAARASIRSLGKLTSFVDRRGSVR